MSNQREILFKGFHENPIGKQIITLDGKDIRGDWKYWDIFGRMIDIKTLKYIGKGKFGSQTFMPELILFVDIMLDTVCEYTGLTDKKGNRIWEHSTVNFLGHKCKVVFEQGAFGLATEDAFNYGYIDEKTQSITGKSWTGLFNDNFISIWEIVWNLDCEENCLDVCELIGDRFNTRSVE